MSTIKNVIEECVGLISLMLQMGGDKKNMCGLYKFSFLAVQVIFICVYITNYLHFFTMFLTP